MNRLAHKIHKLRKKVDGMATDSESEKEAIKKEIERLLEEKTFYTISGHERSKLQAYVLCSIC